ncbi:MAG: hypothetical protein IT564_08840 [Rhodospirillales bacterium]|nr:hypothetical protein [Rhodospirillales bacterium]
MRETKKFHEVHPGVLLKEELAARNMSAATSPSSSAPRIGTALGTGARLWLAMQQAYDLRKAEVEFGAKVRSEVEHAA